MMNAERIFLKAMRGSCYFTFILFAALASTNPVSAANIHSKDNFQIVIEGEIRKGDFNRFIRLAKAGQGRVSGIRLYSPGGDFFESMKIGRAIRALDLSSMAPPVVRGKPNCIDYVSKKSLVQEDKNCTCASSCFFIHVAATHRGGHFLAVHRPYFASNEYGNLPQKKAKKLYDLLMANAEVYLSDMGVPKHLRDEVLAIPSNKAKVLSMETVKTHFWLKLPYKAEWLLNKCGDDKGKYDEKISDCYIEEDRKSRVEAFQEYFGDKPEPANVHDYSIWEDAPKLLKKSPDQMRSSGGFMYTESGWLRILRKYATFYAPDIQLFLKRGDDSLVESVHFVEKDKSEQLRKNIINAITVSFGSKPTSSIDKYDQDTLIWKSVSKGIQGEMNITGEGEIMYGVERLLE